jgi:hypothetical protein
VQREQRALRVVHRLLDAVVGEPGLQRLLVVLVEGGQVHERRVAGALLLSLGR